nr:unnamed protein product [Callosobruchus analis]
MHFDLTEAFGTFGKQYLEDKLEKLDILINLGSSQVRGSYRFKKGKTDQQSRN